jgi:hypothetical protein
MMSYYFGGLSKKNIIIGGKQCNFCRKKNYSIIIMTSKKKFENSLFFQDIREILPKRLASPMKEIKITKTRRP